MKNVSLNRCDRCTLDGPKFFEERSRLPPVILEGMECEHPCQIIADALNADLAGDPTYFLVEADEVTSRSLVELHSRYPTEAPLKKGRFSLAQEDWNWERDPNASSSSACKKRRVTQNIQLAWRTEIDLLSSLAQLPKEAQILWFNHLRPITVLPTLAKT